MTSLPEGIAKVSVEAGGVIDVRLAHANDGPGLMLAALAGDLDAAKLMIPFADAMSRIRNAPKHRPALCATCPEPLQGRQFTIGLAIPSCKNPSAGLGFGICHHCAGDLEELQQKALEALRTIWPSARSVIIHPAVRA